MMRVTASIALVYFASLVSGALAAEIEPSTRAATSAENEVRNTSRHSYEVQHPLSNDRASDADVLKELNYHKNGRRALNMQLMMGKGKGKGIGNNPGKGKGLQTGTGKGGGNIPGMGKGGKGKGHSGKGGGSTKGKKSKGKKSSYHDTLYGIAARERDLSVFYSLACRSGFDTDVLDNLFIESTVFAPTDEAFRLMNQTLLGQIRNEGEGGVLHRRTLLNSHTSPLVLYSDDLFQGLEIPTLESTAITVSSTRGGIFLTRANNRNVPIVEADFEAKNGVLHKICEVLVPPELLINPLDFLATATSQFTTLVRWIAEFGLEAEVRNNVLTIIAPNDAAFQALPRRRLVAMDDATRRAILLYHLIPGLYPTEALSPTQRLRTREGSFMQYTSQGRISGTRTQHFFDSVPAIQVDLIASNAVIHEIGSVLIPPTQQTPVTPTRSPTLPPGTTRPPTQTPGVTRPPTKAPTRAPTLAPGTTKAPTTKAPTRAPTTAAPTKAPTAAPTKAPTAAPTAAPTKAPTAAPAA